MRTELWDMKSVEQLFNLPFLELVYKAHTIHQDYFATSEMQLCTLLSVKTGSCPEDCAYCPQSGHYQTEIEKEKILDIESVLEKAHAAKMNGATRFCMGAAWRNPPEKYFPRILEMVKAVKLLGLETCVTLGMLSDNQAKQLKEAELDFYNHNIDTSPNYYQKIISTRTYQDRLTTLTKVREAGIKVCCGGIIGMGESREDRVALLLQLVSLNPHPESVPINRLIPIKGTPLANIKQIDNFEFLRTIAVARILMPTSRIRLSAGRDEMSQEMQTLCFMAGTNSIFFGDKLLTANNPNKDEDLEFLEKLGMRVAKDSAVCC